ncbi:MAG: hypothetical protein ABUT39_02870 [Acidobacteriota bacterium]
MPPSCGDWLSVLQRHLRPPLFKPEGTERLRRLARGLPGDLLTVLELRLGNSGGPIDLAFRLTGPEEALRIADVLPASQARRFLSAWAEPDTALSSIHSAWVEFDLDRELREVPSPVVCAKLTSDAPLPWLTGTLFPAMHGKPLTPAQERIVRLCHESLPSSAYVLYAFSLLSRGADTLRLEIFGLSPTTILAYLDRVAPTAVSWVKGPAALFQGVERVHLSLDIGEEILPRIGIEGSFSRLPNWEPGWRKLFGRLIDQGLCRPEERDAALAWRGSDTFWTAPAAWPVEAIGPVGFCFRKLSHVKVVCRPDRRLEAKLYLMLGYLP